MCRSAFRRRYSERNAGGRLSVFAVYPVFPCAHRVLASNFGCNASDAARKGGLMERDPQEQELQPCGSCGGVGTVPQEPLLESRYLETRVAGQGRPSYRFETLESDQEAVSCVRCEGRGVELYEVEPNPWRAEQGLISGQFVIESGGIRRRYRFCCSSDYDSQRQRYLAAIKWWQSQCRADQTEWSEQICEQRVDFYKADDGMRATLLRWLRGGGLSCVDWDLVPVYLGREARLEAERVWFAVQDLLAEAGSSTAVESP